ncbi:MAG: nitroreductase family protein [Prevotella sp.]|nr:nitroreductase family protein [Prevotella sp.]
MKSSHLLNFLLAIALVLVSAQMVFVKSGNASSVNAEEAVLENILGRRSVRSYQDKAVEDDKIEKLVRAGMAAPSARDKRPWHFVVVTDKETLQAIAKANPHADMAAKAPLVIVVCGNKERMFEGEAKEFWVQDVSAATENILLAAHAMGLGAVWTGAYPIKERCKALAEAIGLNENYVPLCAVVIGYSDKETQAKDKYNEDDVTYL